MKNKDRKHVQLKRDGESGTLYIVSTPIGNMEDITLRALNILKKADIIAAESVVHSRGLCEHYEIKTRLIRYNQHNHRVQTPKLIERLKTGKNVAIITDAGTPGISDPGIHLIRLAADEGICISPIPGPSAVTAALSASGFPAEQFIFLGFLPNKSGKRKKALEALAKESRTLVFYEAPHRVRAMLVDVKDILGNRQMVMFREMTKIFEDIERGLVSQILNHLTPENTRGEFALVIEGNNTPDTKELTEDLRTEIEDLLKEGSISLKDIAEKISSETGIAYRQIYKVCVSEKRNLEKV